MSCATMTKGLLNDYQIEFAFNNVRTDILRTIGYIIYFNSVITTALLAIDRYVAVKYTFEYTAMLTKRKIIFILNFFWLLSAALASVSWVNVSVYSDLHRNLTITLIVLRFIVSFTLLGLSKYTYVVRKQRMKDIITRNRYYGAEKEKFDRLKAIKSTLKDSFKFYIATVMIIGVLSSIGVVELIFSEFRFEIKLVVAMLSQVSDILVVSLTYREVRQELKHVIYYVVIRRNFTRQRINATSTALGLPNEQNISKAASTDSTSV